MKRQRRTSRTTVVTMALAVLLGSAACREAVGRAQVHDPVPAGTSARSRGTGRNALLQHPARRSALPRGRRRWRHRALITVLEDRAGSVRHRGAARAWPEARVVEEREWKDGEIVEVSRNFYARCKETNDVYYFGEDVDIYEDGVVVSHDGAWLAGGQGSRGAPGTDHARAPSCSARGTSRSRRRPSREDRAEHVRMGLTVKTPAGTFEELRRGRGDDPAGARRSEHQALLPRDRARHGRRHHAGGVSTSRPTTTAG